MRSEINNTEELIAYVCDNLCKYPGEYKDPDELWNERCDHCPLTDYTEEQNG